MKSVNIFILLAVSVFASGCATGPNSHDPLEPMNRKIYAFNKTVDSIVVKPAARAYTAFVPSLVRTGVRNFYTNLGVLNTAFNDLLQGKVSNVPSDVARFTTNLILGVGGTAITVVLVVLFNLISDLTGGVRFTMIEEETAVRRRKIESDNNIYEDEKNLPT